MPTSALVLGSAVVLLTALFAAAYHFVPLYWAYQATDGYKRADAVRHEAARLRAELRVAETPPSAVPAEKIRADAYRDCLRGTSVRALKSYPGVGDVTVQRLLDAGYLTLLDADGRLTQPTFHVQEIGPSRVAEIVNAARAELRKQRQDFDGGANPFARRAAAEIARLTAERDASVDRDRATAERMRQTLRELQPRLSAAGRVTFWAFLKQRKVSPDQPWPCDPALAALPPRAMAVATLLPPPATPDLPLARRPDPAPAVPPPFPANVAAVATLLFGVARADGRLAAPERAAVRRGLARFFETDPVLVRFIDPALDRLAAAALDLDAALRLAVALPRRERDLLRRCADDVASATATRHAAKSQMVQRLDRALTLPGEVVVPPPAPDPSELRSNALLDGLFGSPEPATPAATPVAAGQGLRDNALLDDVFGGR